MRPARHAKLQRANSWFGVEVIGYGSFDDLAEQVEAADTDVQKNQQKMTAELNRYYQELACLYQ
jgi:hypothetical protein